MIPDTNFYIQRTTAELTTSKATSIFKAYWRKKEEKKRIKPLNRPKRKAAMNYNQKLRTGKLSPNYATVWVAMGQREGTVFPFCSKFFFQLFLFTYDICNLLLSPIYISYRMSWGKMDGIICLWPTEGFKFLSRLLVIYNPELCPYTDECQFFCFINLTYPLWPTSCRRWNLCSIYAKNLLSLFENISFKRQLKQM